MRAIVALYLMVAGVVTARGDWPTYRHDVRRSGATAEAVAAAELGVAWTLDTGTPPRSAWAGAAKYDAYGNVFNLKSMRNYDPVFHPVIAGGLVLYGSSVDHGVHALDLETGRGRWTCFTDGPVRVAPSVVDGLVCFGSDDGSVRGVRLEDGGTVWTFAPPAAGRLIHEGNVISLTPCRSGVLVDGDLAYASFSLFPWRPSLLVALDRRTGAVAFSRDLQGLTLEGPMLATPDRLLSPQGRISPLAFDRRDGKPLGPLPGGGGCTVVIGEDGRVFHGPGNKSPRIYVSDATWRGALAQYEGASALVAERDAIYVLSGGDLIKLEAGTKPRLAWKVPCSCTFELIKAGDHLFAGGRDEVAAFRASDGGLVWRAPVRGRAFGLASAAGRLVVSTDDGVLHAFAPGGAAVGEVPARAAEPVPGPPAKPEAGALVVPIGPWLRFTAADRGVVRWRSARPVPSLVRLEGPDGPREFGGTEPTLEHRVEIAGLRRDLAYRYRIVERAAEGERVSGPFECDLFFNDFQRPGGVTGAATSPAGRLADRLLAAGSGETDVCLVWGSGDGELVAALAERSPVRVIGCDDDPARVAAARRRLVAAGLQGSRAVILTVASLREPLDVERFADLVVVAGSDGSAALPAVRPGGVVAMTAAVGDETGFVAIGDLDRESAWRVLRRESPPGAGAWTHQYGGPDNTAYGGESLGGARTADDLRPLWIGRPGPRDQADRSGRKPSPLAAGGRLYVQGLDRITALNASNGTLLWRLEVPDLARFNVPRDCSNWCADETHVYAAVRDQVWKIRGRDGEVEAFVPVAAGRRPDWAYDWGYVARAGDRLIGSAVKRGTRLTDFWGGAGWYDDKAAATVKICSDRLFALDAASGTHRWSYGRGQILNSTIAVAGDRVVFVECRHPAVEKTDTHRVAAAELWLDQHLVALDADSGKTLWERPIDTADGNVLFHLAAAGDRLVLVSSEIRYHVHAFDAATGEPLWSQQFDWPSDHHGGHMSRPAIVGGKVFVRPRVLDLATGGLLAERMPGGGCGSYAATDSSLVFRAGNLTIWDAAAGTTSNWPRLRPDCWISTIPAGGLLLSPEGGGGCSCGSWLETSIAFMPDQRAGPRIEAPTAAFVDRGRVTLVPRGRPGGTIRYTLDGSDPGTSSAAYEDPIELTATSTIRARTFWQGTASNVSKRLVERAYPPPTMTPASIPFVGALAVTVARPGSMGTIRYTLDGSEPTASSPACTGPLSLTTSTSLKARIEYEDGTLSPVTAQTYEAVDATPRQPEEPGRLAPGLVCTAYLGTWDKLPDFSGQPVEARSVVEGVSLDPRPANEAFGLRFEGWLRVPVGGVYRFYTVSDDGSRLWIGDELVVDNDGTHGAQERSGWVALEAGLHRLRIDYWDATWNEYLAVTFEGPGLARQPLPRDAIFHRAEDAP